MTTKLAPYSKAKLNQLKKLVKIDGVFPFELTYALPNVDAVTSMGRATSITPLEFIWAAVLKYKDDLENGPSDDEIAFIRCAVLSCKVQLVVDDNPVTNVWKINQGRSKAANI